MISCKKKKFSFWLTIEKEIQRLLNNVKYFLTKPLNTKRPVPIANTTFKLVRYADFIFHDRYRLPYDDQGNCICIVGICTDITERKQIENELKEAIENIKTLGGLIPICSSCKKIRDDKGYWNILDSYIQKHSTAQFSHSMCPECSDKLYGDEDWYIEMKKKNKNKS